MKSSNPSSQLLNPKPHKRVAIVCDWLTGFGGAERVVLALNEAFPDAPIYTSVYEPEPALRRALEGADIHTTFIQRFPRPIRKFHKWFPVIRTWGFRRLDLSEFDIILSSSSAESKQVKKTRPGQVHVCYCHTPIRYYWSHYHEYKKDPGFGPLNWLVKLLIPIFIPSQRKSDYKAAQNVDVFIANSTEVQKRIKKYYGKPSLVIHPPIDSSRFKPSVTRGNYYMAVGRQVPYKRIDLAVLAATKLNVKLKVFGNGSENQRLRSLAGPSVTFYTDRNGNASDKMLEKSLNRARGFIFPTEEDFGIVQVEALASGTPVIAYGKGGAVDIVQDGESGVLFYEQTVDSVTEAIKKAEQMTFSPDMLHRKAKRFDKGLFITKIRKVIADNS